MEALDIAFDFIAKKENAPLYEAINKIRNYNNTIDSSQSTVGGTGSESIFFDEYYEPNNATGMITLLDTYKDPSGNDTYGYGIEEQYINKKAKTIPEMELQFKERLKKDLNFVDKLTNTKGKRLNLNDNQKAAITSLVYNLGQTGFKYKKINGKRTNQLTNAYTALINEDFETFKKEAFDKNEGFVGKKGTPDYEGLVNRRREEQELFETPRGTDKDFSAQPIDNVEIEAEPLDSTANIMAKTRAGLI